MKKESVLMRFLASSESKNIPSMVLFELTKRCNLECIHCYLTRKKGKKELDASEIKRIISELSEAGCLFLTFTGGEIFARKDIFDILEHSQKLNFAVKLFTNGTLISEKEAEKIKECNIWEIDISLYHTDSKVHDEITSVEGSWEKAVNAIKILKERNMIVRIKCPIMKVNAGNIAGMVGFAKKHRVKISFDPVISPRDDGKTDNLRYRVSCGDLKIIFRNRDIFDIGKISIETKENGNLACKAGKVFFGISAYGEVYPCLQLPVISGNLREKSLIDIWKNSKELKKIRNTEREDIKECLKCGISELCNRCPGLAYLENGNIYGKSDIACKIAGIKADILKNKSPLFSPFFKGGKRGI